MRSELGPEPVFRLDRGVTGFYDPKTGPLPMVDVSAFRAGWHTAARIACGRVGNFIPQTYPRTFHTATITNGHGAHVILCHAHFPLIAFVADQRYSYSDEFREAPTWSSAFTDAAFVVLSLHQLNSPLSKADTSTLAAGERQAIRHWRPTSIGQVIFNSWD
ncbi:hypothetical protein LO771_07825 [Streptacidiphilus sp. ASG 303]|uniref:hypothetical protein n=1 Tax=Streptacidiphilus sp. ASG 303 TaxID=2896847 RepID=UPI001E3363EC|nr:hypothetical protein [Streptacidiphilus sp. ASG 303]MCD0482322.1 hypothetical protein [Streptacidiphilus sp. ASG 303]